MNIKSVFSSILNFFKNGSAQRDAELALHYAVEALPYIKLAGDVVVGLTPTAIDNIAWAALNVKYPKLFDGSLHTPDELKALALGVAASLLESKFPKLSTTVAVLATQLAFTQAKADQQIPDLGLPPLPPKAA